MMNRFAALALVTAALLTLGVTGALAMDGNTPSVFPAYYDGGIRQVLMSPSSNSENPNQVRAACYQVGPDFSTSDRAADVPVMYTLFVPGATQMSCHDGTRVHDMVLTAVPGDEGYNGAVRVTRCLAGPNFSIEDMPYDSAAAVEAGIAGGELVCTRLFVALSPVVG
jgi:hypothetical protein